MTIPTPTSNPGTFPGGIAVPTGIGPASLDPGEILRLADSFFRALPGETVPPIQASSPGRMPSESAIPFSGAPAYPGNVPGGFPGHFQGAAPSGLTGSLPGPLPESVPRGGPSVSPSAPQTAFAPQGVPEAYAAALPSVGAPVPVSHSPYYFLDHGRTAPSEDPLDALAHAGAGNSQGRTGAGSDQVTALPFGLPGQDALSGLLLAPEAPRPGRSSSVSPVGNNHAPRGGVPADGFARGPDYSFLSGNTAVGGSSGMLDVHSIRRDFPILAERVNGKPLIWFDNAATTQKPRAVIDRISHFYSHENSNIHRAAHELAARSTDAYEGARRKVADFLGAKGPEEIIFVRGATEAINLVARTYGRQEIHEGDEILVSHLEHHANIVPWQMLAENKKARIRVIPVDDSGQIRLDEYGKLLGPKTKLVAITQVSNALGTVTPIAQIIAMAHGAGAKVLVDGAQAVSHMRVNVQALDADFYVFSGHKVFGPTGIGVVYGKKALLDRMPPWQGGGNMIADVTFEQTVYQPAPAKFEAGTGNIADAVGLGAAIDYVQRIGMERIGQYEHALLEYATARLGVIPGVRLVGTAREKASVLSFVLAGYKTEEVGAALNKEGIAVRSGHHCAQPILRRFGLEATVRPSLAFYNTCEEVDTFIQVIRRLSSRR
jgi:cysteine desulfurase/selenocysteine lyase